MTITRWPPAERVYGEVRIAWRTTPHHACRSRATVLSEESEITFEDYEVPCPEGLGRPRRAQYIKDRIDGTLSYRWSCRMGICGSCGMTVNGEPKLTCATFLSDYAPGPVRVEPLRNFPVIRDLVVEIGDFMRKLTQGEAVDRPRRSEKPLSEGEYRQTPEELDEYKQFSMCINCMLCYAACPIYGLDPKFIGPAAIALAQRYNLDSRDEGAAGAACRSSREHEGIWGCTFVGECTKVCPKHVDPAGAIQRYKLQCGAGLGQGVLHAEGRAMNRNAAYTPYHPRWHRQRVSTYWWLQAPSYFAVHPAGAEQRLRGVVRRVPAAAGARRRRRGRQLPALSRVVGGIRSSCC